MALVLAVLCSPTAASAAQRWYRWPGCTLEQAREVVREFEGRPDLQFTAERCGDALDEFTREPLDFVLSRCWWLVAETRRYGVSAYDPQYFWMTDDQWFEDPQAFYGGPHDEDTLRQRVMSRDQAKAVADDFARAHYAGFDRLNASASSAFPGGACGDEGWAQVYRFEYRLRLPGEVATPVGCTVEVDAVFGRIVGYMQTRLPILVDTKPLLTPRQAGLAAINALIAHEGFVEERCAELCVTAPDALGLERLIWWVRISGFENLSPEMWEARFDVAVDAHTGDVVYWERLLGCLVVDPADTIEPKPDAGPKLRLLLSRSGALVQAVYPPISAAGRTYLYLLNLPGLGAEMELLSAGRAMLKTARATGYVDAKRGILTLNDRPFLRYGRPLIIRGRTYVPLDFARRLLGDVSLTVRHALPPE
jgi:hypothetical protein